MLGFGDWWIALAYIGSILATLICVVYGVMTWNKSDEKEEDGE